jgi:hypothetical protein
MSHSGLIDPHVVNPFMPPVFLYSAALLRLDTRSVYAPPTPTHAKFNCWAKYLNPEKKISSGR